MLFPAVIKLTIPLTLALRNLTDWLATKNVAVRRKPSGLSAFSHAKPGDLRRSATWVGISNTLLTVFLSDGDRGLCQRR